MRFLKRFILSHSDSYNNALQRIDEFENRTPIMRQFCANSKNILAVMNRMGDEKSRAAYKNEVVTLLLGAGGLEISQRLGFTVSFEEMEKQLKSVNPAGCPDVEYPPEWNFPPQAAGHAFAYPQYEYEDKVCLEEGEVFFDCGACAGEVAVWAQSKVGAGGRVFAFEPSPRTFEILKRNLAKFAPEVQPFNSAIGDSWGGGGR